MNRNGLILLFFLVIVMGSFVGGKNDLAVTKSDLTKTRQDLEQSQMQQSRMQQELEQSQQEQAKTLEDLNRARREWARILELEREARCVPITLEIMDQVEDSRRSLKEPGYFISMPLTLIVDDPSRNLDINDGEITYREQNDARQIKVNITSKGRLVNDPALSDNVLKFISRMNRLP
jgi:uncharacterized protein (DUF3084 family)